MDLSFKLLVLLLDLIHLFLMLLCVLLQFFILLVFGALNSRCELCYRALQLLAFLLKLCDFVVLSKEVVPSCSYARRSQPHAALHGLSSSRTGSYMLLSGCGTNHVL